MRKNTSLSIPQRILLGVTLFTFLAAFSATGVLIVLKTAPKTTSNEDLAPKEIVVEIANQDVDTEQSKTKETLLPQQII